MVKRSGLETLIELAERSRDDAAALLAHTLEIERTDREKLALLQNYRNEYAAQFKVHQASGMSVASFHNFQHFLHKLDGALKRQSAQIEADVQAVQTAQKMWQETQRKLKSYGVLEERGRIRQQQHTQRIEQKQSDEFSSHRRRKEIKP